jgi:hypothetical protein
MPVLLGLASMAHLARDPRAWSFIFFYGRCVIHPNFFRKKKSNDTSSDFAHIPTTMVSEKSGLKVFFIQKPIFDTKHLRHLNKSIIGLKKISKLKINLKQKKYS